MHAKVGQPTRKAPGLGQNEYIGIQKLEGGDQEGLEIPSEVLESGLQPHNTT